MIILCCGNQTTGFGFLRTDSGWLS